MSEIPFETPEQAAAFDALAQALADDVTTPEEEAEWEETRWDLPQSEFQAAWEEDAANYPDDDGLGMADYWNPVEQGMYDDDPSPYNGDYSEM